MEKGIGEVREEKRYWMRERERENGWWGGRGEEVVARERDCRKAEKERDDVG